MDALRELIALFGIEVDDKELKEADKGIDGFVTKLEGVATHLAEAFAVKEVYEFVESQVEAAAHVQDLAERLDLTATEISNFGFVAKSAGVDADGAARSLGFLEKTLGEAASKGGPAADTLRALGVATKDTHGEARPLLDVVGDLSDAIANLPDQNRKAAVAMELFGREGRNLLPILNKGGEAMADLLKEAGELGNGLGDAYFEDAKKAREESEKLGRVWQSLKERATSILLPAVVYLTDVVKDASKWMLEHAKTTEALEYALGALAVVIAVALTDALLGAAAAAWALLAPFAPAVAGVAALTWVIQDLITLVQGGDSVIADFVESLAGVGAKRALIEGLSEAWKEVKGDIDSVAFALGYFVGLWEAFGKSVAGSPIAQAIGDSLKELGIDINDATSASHLFLLTLQAVKEVLISMTPGLGLLVAASRALGLAKGTTYSADATHHGVPAEVVQQIASEPGPWRNPELHPGTRNPVAWSRGRGPETSREPVAPHVGGSIAASLPPVAPHVGGGVTIHQENKNDIHVQTHSDAPQEVGEAVGAGVATATQKDLNNALTSVVKP